MVKHPWRKILLITALWVVPPLLVSAAVVAYGVPSVYRSGMCPAAPPDIPAYPCTVLDYLLRMTVGPWALLGHLTIAGAWTITLGCLLLLGMIWRSLSRPARSTSPHGQPGESPSTGSPAEVSDDTR